MWLSQTHAGSRCASLSHRGTASASTSKSSSRETTPRSFQEKRAGSEQSQHCQQDFSSPFPISSVCIHLELLMPLQRSWQGRPAFLHQEGGSIPGCAQLTGQTPEGSFLLDPRRCCRAKQSERRLGSKPTLQHKTSINSSGIWPLHKCGLQLYNSDNNVNSLGESQLF